MHYAEGPTTEAEVHVEAPPAAVWPLVCDVDLPSRFSSELVGGEWAEGSGPGLGGRFVGRNRHQQVGEWQTTCVVVEFEPERRFGWAVGDPARPSACWRFELEPDGAGTRLRQWTRLGPGPSYLTVVIERMPDREEHIIERRLAEHRANMEATLRGIKAAAEQVSGETATSADAT
jgi:Polyketide cyclase / dehydrase and lipid transport